LVWNEGDKDMEDEIKRWNTRKIISWIRDIKRKRNMNVKNKMHKEQEITK
jgi:hypothetical protein